MENLKIGTKVKIKSKEELKELFDREYNRSNDEWNKKTEKNGTIVFLDNMLAYCGRECTIASEFTGLGYYMGGIGCYWNPDWFDVIKPSIKVGDTIVLKTMAEAAKDEETLKNHRYTFGDITYEDYWGKECEVELVEAGIISVRRRADDRRICIPSAWISSVVSKEETYRRKIEDYVSKHNFKESLPDENAPYDWTIQIDKGHHFIKAYVLVDGFRFEVFEGLDGTFEVVK